MGSRVLHRGIRQNAVETRSLLPCKVKGRLQRFRSRRFQSGRSGAPKCDRLPNRVISFEWESLLGCLSYMGAARNLPHSTV